MTARRESLFTVILNTRWLVPALLALALVVQLAYAMSNNAPPIFDEVGHTRAAQTLLQIHSLDDVHEAVRSSLRYGLVYPLWLAGIYAITGENPFVARAVQGIIAVATLALLYLVAREVYGRYAGIVALGLGVLYLPFVTTAARLLSETLAVFWLALALLLAVHGLRQNNARAFVAAGFVAVLAGLTRPTLQLLFVALLVGVWSALWLSKQPLRRSLWFVAGVLLLLVPWLLFTRITIGRATLSGSVSPAEGIFIGNYAPDDGIPTDARSFLQQYPQPEFAYIQNSNYVLKGSDFVRATLQVARHDPIGLILLQVRKLYDQWRAPFNDFEIGFGLPYSVQIIWHALIIGGGVLGGLAFLRRQPITALFIVGWLYVIASNLLVPVERRYAYPAIPFALILAGAVGGEWLANLRQPRAWRAIVVALGLGLVCAFGAAPLAAFISGVTGATTISVIARILLLGIAALALAWAIARYDSSMRIAAYVLVLGTFLMVVTFGLTTINWHQTKASLSEGERADKTFSLLAPLSEYTSAALYIDGQNLSPAQVSADQASAPLPLQMKPNTALQYNTYARLIARRAATPPDLPQWFQFDMDPRTLIPNVPLHVQITGPATLVSDDRADATRVILPALDSLQLSSDTSLYKYLADDDYRIPRELVISSGSSPANLRSHILLVLTRADGTQTVLW